MLVEYLWTKHNDYDRRLLHLCRGLLLVRDGTTVSGTANIGITKNQALLSFAGPEIIFSWSSDIYQEGLSTKA